MSEVFARYTDTAGNEHWSDTETGHHVIPKLNLIEGLSSAQPERKTDGDMKGKGEMMDEIIRRQDALESINRIWDRCEEIEAHLPDGDPDKTGYKMIEDYLTVWKYLSAEPEIIHCEDCKHRDPEDKKCDCGHDILWQLPRRDDWFCADAERRADETD